MMDEPEAYADANSWQLTVPSHMHLQREKMKLLE